jgi:aldose 1-epimerase
MSNSGATATKTSFGNMPDGTAVDLCTLRNSKGAEARIATYGSTVVSLSMPDKNGSFGDVVLGHDTLEGYIKSNHFFGCLVGRYGNRIAKGQFTLNGQTYRLAVNNGPNALHGGTKGFDKVVWKIVRLDVGPHGPRVELEYLSKDGEEGYPGNLDVHATYTLTEDNALRLDFVATTDKDTVCNLTHHSYFNLAGQGDVLGYLVQINADKFTPSDGTLIPTGELRPVDGTPFDFRQPTAIGARIGANDEQIRFGNGYDHNWVLNKPADKLGIAARVSDPASGRTMEVWTTQPGLQFYTANYLDRSIVGKGGWAYTAHAGFCMEPQHFPDSPNHPEFPSAELKAGQTYRQTIIYKFSVK